MKQWFAYRRYPIVEFKIFDNPDEAEIEFEKWSNELRKLLFSDSDIYGFPAAWGEVVGYSRWVWSLTTIDGRINNGTGAGSVPGVGE